MVDLDGYKDGIYAMNVRMFKDFDQNQPGSELKFFDGKSLTNAVYTVGDDTPASTDDLHQANCHCGAVRYSVANTPINAPDSRLNTCNCSVCSKNGYITIYADQANVSFIQGKDHLREYRFGTKRVPHYFCPTCGSSVYFDVDKVFPSKLGINIRMFKEFDVKVVHPKTSDGKSL